MLLCRLLEALPGRVGARAIELGAGCGLGGSVLARHVSTVQRVALTDLSHAIPLLARNVRRLVAGIGAEVRVEGDHERKGDENVDKDDIKEDDQNNKDDIKEDDQNNKDDIKEDDNNYKIDDKNKNDNRNKDSKTTTTIGKQKVIVDVFTLAWGEPLPPLPFVPDTVIASDVVYTPSLYRPLAQTLALLADVNPHLNVLIAYKRRYAREQAFFDLMVDKYHWRMNEIPLDDFIRNAEDRKRNQFDFNFPFSFFNFLIFFLLIKLVEFDDSFHMFEFTRPTREKVEPSNI